eukprot:332204-Rhodomonas_salina.1
MRVQFARACHTDVCLDRAFNAAVPSITTSTRVHEKAPTGAHAVAESFGLRFTTRMLSFTENCDVTANRRTSPRRRAHGLSLSSAAAQRKLRPHHFARLKRPAAFSAIMLPMASELVAPGDGELRTCSSGRGQSCQGAWKSGWDQRPERSVRRDSHSDTRGNSPCEASERQQHIPESVRHAQESSSDTNARRETQWQSHPRLHT